MLPLLSLERAIRDELKKHKDLADFTYRLEESPPGADMSMMYPDGWIGIYVVDADGDPNSFKPPGGKWRFSIRVGVLIYIGGAYTDGEEIFTELDARLADALNVLLYDLKKSGTVDTITAIHVALDVISSAQEELYVRDAAIEITCIITESSNL